MSFRKAQTFSLDLMVSVTVFIMLLVVASFIWNSTQDKIRSREQQDRFLASADAAANILLKSPGYPADWTPDTVSSLGLAAEPRVLNPVKFMRLKELDAQRAGYLLGIGGYNFSLSLTVNDSVVLSGAVRSPTAYLTAGSATVFNALSGSGLVWDYYSPSIVDAGDSRSQFEGNAAALFQQLFSNASEYDSIILQDSGLTAGEVDLGLVKDFLANGGLLVLVGESDNAAPFYSECFGVQVVNDSVGFAGEVANTSFFIYNSSAGDGVAFLYSNVSLTSWLDSFEVFVSVQGAPEQCLACSWEYGGGKVFYLTEFNATFQTAFGDKTQDEVVNLVGWPMQYTSYPALLSTASVSNRLALLNSGRLKPVSFSLVVWVE
ncbi:MAG: hypothetical protein V1834_00010 [Candidatus Micrarchaeota archaeon]